MFGRTSKDMITVRDVPADAFIAELADHLKKTQKVSPMENHFFIKTGFSREIAPYSEDWFYIRCASLARKLFLRPGLGVGTLRKIYGKNNSRGHKKNHNAKGSGKVIRYCIKQLQEADILMSYYDKRNRGIKREEGMEGTESDYPRILTLGAVKELNEIAAKVFKSLYGDN